MKTALNKPEIVEKESFISNDECSMIIELHEIYSQEESHKLGIRSSIYLAFVGFLASMDQMVLLQMCQLRECFVADLLAEKNHCHIFLYLVHINAFIFFFIF